MIGHDKMKKESKSLEYPILTKSTLKWYKTENYCKINMKSLFWVLIYMKYFSI